MCIILQFKWHCWKNWWGVGGCICQDPRFVIPTAVNSSVTFFIISFNNGLLVSSWDVVIPLSSLALCPPSSLLSSVSVSVFDKSLESSSWSSLEDESLESSLEPEDPLSSLLLLLLLSFDPVYDPEESSPLLLLLPASEEPLSAGAGVICAKTDLWLSSVVLRTMVHSNRSPDNVKYLTWRVWIILVCELYSINKYFSVSSDKSDKYSICDFLTWNWSVTAFSQL